MLAALALSLSLAAADVPPPSPSINAAPRSAALISAEVLQLEQRLAAAPPLKPAWIPLVVGLVGGAALWGLAVVTLVYGPSAAFGFFAVVGAALLAITGTIAAVVGIIIGIAFAGTNVQRQSDRRDLEALLATKREELRLQREREAMAPVVPVTLLSF